MKIYFVIKQHFIPLAKNVDYLTNDIDTTGQNLCLGKAGCILHQQTRCFVSDFNENMWWFTAHLILTIGEIDFSLLKRKKLFEGKKCLGIEY